MAKKEAQKQCGDRIDRDELRFSVDFWRRQWFRVSDFDEIARALKEPNDMGRFEITGLWLLCFHAFHVIFMLAAALIFQEWM